MDRRHMIVTGELGGGRTYALLLSDDFASGLSAIWTAALGTFNTNAGKARGATIAADGNNLLTLMGTTSEFTADTLGWSAAGGATLTRRDYTSSPDIDPTGGADNFGMEVTNGSNGYATETGIAIVPGVTYLFSAQGYSPSADTQANAAAIWFTDGDAPASKATTVEDVWQALSNTKLAYASAVVGAIRLYCQGTTAGDKAHYDMVKIQAQHAILTCDPGEADIDISVKVTLPASGVKPFGIVARYQNAANYWLWRIRPGTAGVDFELVKVASGVQSVAATADVDWQASTEYTLRLKQYGTKFSGSVDGVETLTHTDATNFNTTETKVGLFEAGATNGLFDDWEVRQCAPF